MAMAAVAAVVIALLAILNRSGDQGTESDEASNGTDESTSGPERADGSSDAAQQGGASAVGIAGSGTEWLAVLRRNSVTLIDPETLNESPYALPGVANDPSVAVLDGALVYIHGASAWAVNVDGTARVLGPADTVVGGADTDRVWLGMTAARADGLGTAVSAVSWSEVDADGATHRTAVREESTEFSRPDVVWGFNSSIYRLSDRDVHPWRLIGQGFPVAIGPNDVVLNVCSRARECERQWFDTQTGEARGGVFDDLAVRLPERYGGTLSPDGRFITNDQRDTGRLAVRAVVSDDVISDSCRQSEPVAWSTNGELLACNTDEGVVVVDLASGESVTASATSADGLVFVNAPTE